jgi:uncharacterized protein YecE (DUF72 family)
MSTIVIGTSGFSFDDWIGEVYPPTIRKQDMLPYYERVLGFSALEVNFTYYTLPSARTMESFVRRTSPGFHFVVKAFKGITHERSSRLKDECRLFREGLAPLGDSLKALLFQFPFAFKPGDDSLRYLEFLRREFGDSKAVVEFRNARWLSEETMGFLRGLDFGYCIVDEPKLKGLVPFYPCLTSDVGYVRFHGRNEAWFGSSVEVRYDYLYSDEELKEFVAPVLDLSRKAETTYLFFNNCHAGKAVRNAKTFAAMLKAAQSGEGA